MDPKETGSDGVEWLDLARDTERRRVLVSTVMTYRVPSNCGSVWTGLGTVGFSRWTVLHVVS
jgi:hypothetical protein